MVPNNSSPEDQEGLWILDVTLKSHKPLNSVTLEITTPTNNGSVIHREDKTADSLQTTFVLPRDTTLASRSVVRITYPRSVLPKKIIEIKGADLLRTYRRGGEEKQSWTNSYGKAILVVQLANRSRKSPTPHLGTDNELPSTTSEIRKICPRFRILVLGKSGAGKSSLINKVFGVTDALVSDEMPGEADIDKEIPSKENPFFVLHDSRGFEGGETETLNIVQDFIRRRGRMSEIEMKLHLVWVCVEIQTTGGRLMEIGLEEFFKSGAGGHLGKVPIIVVFTKYDELVTTERIAMEKEGLAATIEEAEERAKERIENECVSPFKAIVGENLPYVTVSTDPRYRSTFTKLIDVTYEKVTGYITEAGILSGISQKINPNVKILTSIEVGKRNYWKGLVSKTVPGLTMQNFLGVIHGDMVNVWNLEDKHNYLNCVDFKELMLRTVRDLEARDPNETIVMGAKIVGAVASIAALFSGPAMLITLPITATIAAALWIYDANRQTHDNLRRMMTYIVSLTIVMQNLFWIQSILATRPKPGSSDTSDRVAVPITRRLIILALHLYLNATDRESLLGQIDSYAKKVNFVTHRSDATVKEITRLLHSSTVNSEDAFKQQKEIKKLDRSWEDEADVSWSSSIA